MTDDVLDIAGRIFTSRLVLGTGGAPSSQRRESVGAWPFSAA